METISFDEMSTLDVPSAALRSSLDKIASALQKVGAAGTDASAAVDELRTSLRAAAAQSVKSARSLAKFDEINRLSAPAAEKADAEKTTAAAKKTGGSTRKSGSRSGSRAKAEADGEVIIWQAALQTLRDAWDGFWLYLQTYYGPAIAAWQAAWEQIKQTALAVWEPVRAAALDLWNGALQPLADYLLTVFLPGVANSFSQAFAPILGGTISAAMTILGNLFVWLCGLIGELVNTVVQPALALLLEIWQGVMDGITAAWQAYGQPILDGLVQAFQGLTDLLTALWQSVLQPVLTDLISLIGTLWSEHLQPLWQQLTMALGAVMNLVLTVWNTVLMPLAAWLVSTLGPVVAQVFNGIASVVGVAIGLVADAVNIGLTILQGLADFLTAVLQGRWSTAWNAMAATVTTVWSKITFDDSKRGQRHFVGGAGHGQRHPKRCQRPAVVHRFGAQCSGQRHRFRDGPQPAGGAARRSRAGRSAGPGAGGGRSHPAKSQVSCAAGRSGCGHQCGGSAGHDPAGDGRGFDRLEWRKRRPAYQRVHR